MSIDYRAEQRYRAHKISETFKLDAKVRETLPTDAMNDLLWVRSRDIRSRQEAEIAWAAGLFEGEGCWGCHNGKLSAVLITGDHDVITRFADVVKVGSVSSNPKTQRKPNHRVMWRWSTSNASVVEIALLFWPFLGKRRRDMFVEKLKKREEFIQTATKERVCPSCRSLFRPRYSKMASRTKYCSDRCSQNSRRTRKCPVI